MRPWHGQAGWRPGVKEQSPLEREGGRRREGEGRAAPGSQVRHLGGPGPSAGPAKCPPGRLADRAGSQLHLGSRRGLKNQVAGAAVWKQGPAVIVGAGGRARALKTFTGHVGTRKKKNTQINHFHPAWAVKIKAAFRRGRAGVLKFSVCFALV